MFPTVLSANTPASGAYQISNSVRLRSNANGNFYRSFTTPTSAYKWTYSGWLKRGIIGSSSRMTFFSNNSYPTYALVSFVASTDQLSLLFQMSDNQAVYVTTNAVFRDPSAWYNIVVSFDSTQSNQASRLFLYVNGVATTFSAVSPYLTYPNQNTYTGINSATQHNLSNLIISGYGPYSEWFDGYRADINFIDGQALTPSSFGQINPTTGVWQPIKYAGSYGTNGFHLAFNNGTSTTTLGNDSSGNGNNWTPNNISLTAGSTYDWMIDSPTPYAGTSYGVGNYAVLNPISNPNGPIFTLSGANLNYSCSASAGNGNKMSVLASIGMSSGKWYCEATEISSNSGFGVASELVVGGSANGSQYAAAFGPGGALASAATYSGTSPTFTTNDVIGLAFDAGAKTLTIYKNGTSLGSFSGLESTVASWFFIQTVWTGASATSSNWNFGQRPFAYTLPSGYKTLCTQNLPSPTIQNGAAHFAATPYTGTGTSQSITNTVNGVSLTPDLTWIKSRSAATDHKLTDIVRGVTKGLISDSTAAETTDTNGLTAFNSNGFTIGSDTVYNNNAATYVAWQWKAGGTAVTNTAGSITSQVSANPTAGFSVVTWSATGTGATQTVGHGLGVIPAMVIAKSRTDGTTYYNWTVYHTSLAANNNLYLSSTSSAGTTPGYGWLGAPTSSAITLSVGSSGNNNVNSGNMIAYCFAAIPGYSAFGSYKGNGSTDGPFVYCGFRPRYVLIKRTDTADAWYIEDSSRNTYNATGLDLSANSSSAELNNTPVMDFLSNGVKMRNSYTGYNASGGTYIYACFAENPFANALAR